MITRSWLLLLLFFPALLKAQSGTPGAVDVPLFKQFRFITPLPLTLYDGKVFNKNDLPKNKPVMVFLFSVECDHCASMTEEILRNMDKFKSTTLLMVTPFKLERMKAWYDQYKIKNYPNIIMAAEPTRQIAQYYALRNFPGIYIYDKKHRLVADYEGTVKLDTLLKHL